jgi:hypothetical protein
MAELEEVEIAPVSAEDLRRDSSGTLVKALAALAYHAFREPPWSDDHEKPRLHFGYRHGLAAPLPLSVSRLRRWRALVRKREPIVVEHEPTA